MESTSLKWLSFVIVGENPQSRQHLARLLYGLNWRPGMRTGDNVIIYGNSSPDTRLFPLCVDTPENRKVITQLGGNFLRPFAYGDTEHQALGDKVSCSNKERQCVHDSCATTAAK